MGAVSGGGGGRAPTVVRRGRAMVVGLGSFRGPRASRFGGWWGSVLARAAAWRGGVATAMMGGDAAMAQAGSAGAQVRVARDGAGVVGRGWRARRPAACAG